MGAQLSQGPELLFFFSPSVKRNNLAAVNYEQSLTIQSNNQFIKGAIYKGSAITAAF